jgi:hypothetical protein
VTGSSVAGVITASATVLIAVGGIISALTLFIPILRETRANKRAIGEVHTIVNQQRTDSQNYQAALIRALTKAGVDIPIDQSQGVTNGVEAQG